MKVFDSERANNIIAACNKIFKYDEISAIAIIKNNDPCLKICYKDIQLDFKCYRYC